MLWRSLKAWKPLNLIGMLLLGAVLLGDAPMFRRGCHPGSLRDPQTKPRRMLEGYSKLLVLQLLKEAIPDSAPQAKLKIILVKSRHIHQTARQMKVSHSSETYLFFLCDDKNLIKFSKK